MAVFRSSNNSSSWLHSRQRGFLVVGWYESVIAALIATKINIFLEQHDLGKVLGADGTLKILPGVVKIPDVSFISWSRWPKQPPDRRPIPTLVPDLVVEVLSETNTPREMSEKLKSYFRAGVRCVWYIDPATRSARIHTSPSVSRNIDPDGFLDGDEVLPGFRLSLRSILDEADRQGPRE
jgi:Uma2 family endonuclease